MGGGEKRASILDVQFALLGETERVCVRVNEEVSKEEKEERKE